MKRLGLSPTVIAEAGVALVDAGGAEALTVRDLASALDVRPSALYKHVEGVDAIRTLVVSAAAERLLHVLIDAATGRSGRDAVNALASAYRSFALDHPGWYSLVAAPDDTAPELTDAFRSMTDLMVRVVEVGYDIEGTEAVHAARTIRSCLHGFVTLESTQGFARPEDRDESFDRMLDTLTRGLATVRDAAVVRN